VTSCSVFIIVQSDVFFALDGNPHPEGNRNSPTMHDMEMACEAEMFRHERVARADNIPA